MKVINSKNINKECYKKFERGTAVDSDEYIFVRHLPENNAPYAEEVLGSKLSNPY